MADFIFFDIAITSNRANNQTALPTALHPGINDILAVCSANPIILDYFVKHFRLDLPFPHSQNRVFPSPCTHMAVVYEIEEKDV